MASTTKTRPTFSKPENSISKESSHEDHQEDSETLKPVTTHLYIKPAHTSETLDKEVVLRRIRQRKWVNKVRDAFRALRSSPFSTKADSEVTVQETRWMDDAFAAP